MELTIVNPQPKYQPVRLIDPPPLGYIHVAAAVEPPRQPGPPFPGDSQAKAALLARLKPLARQLEMLDAVEKVTVYRAIIVPPAGAGARQEARHVARYDVAVLIETTSPRGDQQGPGGAAVPATRRRRDARWGYSLPRFMIHQFAKRSF